MSSDSLWKISKKFLKGRDIGTLRFCIYSDNFEAWWFIVWQISFVWEKLAGKNTNNILSWFLCHLRAYFIIGSCNHLWLDSFWSAWVTVDGATSGGRTHRTLHLQLSLTKRTPSALIQAIHVPGAIENGSAKPFPGTVTKAGCLFGRKMISLLWAASIRNKKNCSRRFSSSQCYDFRYSVWDIQFISEKVEDGYWSYVLIRFIYLFKSCMLYIHMYKSN